MFNFIPSISSNLLYNPSVRLDFAKTMFVYSSSQLWNSMINNIYAKLKPNDMNILVPGSSSNSDLAASVGYFKSRTRTILLELQNRGESVTWHTNNFDPRTISGPSWTWGTGQ